MKKHLNIEIFGKVQGVYFRDEAKKQAESLGLTGFVENIEEGSVYIEVEGEEKSLKKFLEWCQTGSAMAKVENIEIKKGGLKGFLIFKIR